MGWAFRIVCPLRSVDFAHPSSLDQAFLPSSLPDEAIRFCHGWFPEKGPSSECPWGSEWNTQLGGVIDIMEAEPFLIRDTQTISEFRLSLQDTTLPLAAFFTLLPVEKGF